jgi:L-fuculose-phosphate aldolase
MKGFSLLHPRDQIVAIMDRIYAHEMTTTSGGNLSVRDQTGDMWITPARVDKGNLRRHDIVHISANGERK